MTVKKVWAVYFSGTGTTKKTVDRIARRLAEALGTDCEVYDYTLPAARRQKLTIPSGDVAVVGCPTYAGRVPNLLMPYLRDMVHGEGALAVPVSRAVPPAPSISMTPGIYTTRVNWRRFTPGRQRTRRSYKYQRGGRWE